MPITMMIPPFGLSAEENDRALQFDEAMLRLLAQNGITTRLGWQGLTIGDRRVLSFGRFEIDSNEFLEISDYDLFNRVQDALAG